ncbi:hypothetical protein GCM10020254_41880 [Streptomyces goshikiensis]
MQSRKLGPARIGPILGLPASAVHRILARHGLDRLAWLDRPTGETDVRRESARSGLVVPAEPPDHFVPALVQLVDLAPGAGPTHAPGA